MITVTQKLMMHPPHPTKISSSNNSQNNKKSVQLFERNESKTTRLRQKVKRLQGMLSNMTTGAQNIGDLIEGATKYLKEPALSFFASQLRNSSQRVKARGRRWSYRDKVIALSLYHQGPRAYQFCCRLFTLPSISSLQKWLQSVEIL